MADIGFWVAFGAGLLSFLSPCVLPLVPGYISFMSGVSLERLEHSQELPAVARRAGLCSIFFVLGFGFVFTILGASATGAGRLLEAYLPFLTKIAGVVIIIFGLHTAGILKIRWLYYEKRLDARGAPPGFFGAFLMGLAFAFGWTPCIGPILAGILAIAAVQETVARGTALLAVYSAGLGIPFVLTGFATGAFMRFFTRFKRVVRLAEIASGILLVAVGILIFMNRLTILVSLMPSFLMKFAR